ncbi:Phosphoribosylformimino-5-aminoimidazole carboxamide ribotide isomerase [Zopfia rhizophila CBS 207.26]|uniref:1-(5-phosphoribosyl)-5-[(5-phosphoribosylamino)methylideneamino] imidazole-4-carboxamide isomerase n=1 Tax=Zopfia rhizophila CBS 207.26 TaxID=1314779 RepID=A0A6A6DF07_9PEZI|nr:Phosphoribosylformimino-5-aminoimidazole carboxamide ribotide isomerase [Zopfia rhizophila CBS 207.26]
MTRFRPCIDLHAGSVKQIVGGTLSMTSDSSLKTNFTSEQPSSHYADLYKKHNLTGAHVIMLGPGNDEAANEALGAWKGGMQVGGGITEKNAAKWVERGAEKVIVTSYLFPNGTFSFARLQAVLNALGDDKSKLVIDLSCRKKGDGWFVATNKWQTITDFELNQESISLLEPHCSEFLIHAADVEGLQRGIDHELVTKLSEWCTIPVTYAGGGRSIDDLGLVKKLSSGKVDITIGSALDIFGGSSVKFEDCVRWNEAQAKGS